VTWLVWRQHRGESVAAALLLAVLALVVLPSGLHLHQLEATLNIGRCQGTNPDTGCAAALDAFNATSRSLNGIVPWLNLLPGLAGVFIGAPLVAREIEEGTWRLAWSQSVTRRSWLRTQLMGAGAVVVFATIVFTIVVTWWLTPLNHIDGRFASSGHGFDFYGTVPAAWAFFAFAIGVLAGTLARRVVPAMAITFGAYLAIRLPVEFLLRPRYLSAVNLWSVEPTDAHPLGPNNWVFGQDLVAPHSHHTLSATQQELVQRIAQAASPNPKNSGQDVQYLPSLAHYLQTHGYTYVFAYQPAGRFWIFQGIETGICLVLAVLAVCATCWWVSRRLT
jgi:hypothetical protein